MRAAVTDVDGIALFEASSPEFDIPKPLATCVTVKPFKPDSCNAPITVRERTRGRKKEKFHPMGLSILIGFTEAF
ncbi:hypothetical protein KM043_007070 [Ampulex compressa]|nr:hypothetical protein KM043_007070 [Ampulex compressa]